MSNKTPFELRFDVLNMAKEYYDNLYDVNVSFSQRMYDEAVTTGRATWQDWEKFMPKKYTMDDVVAKAQELYAFVLKKD